MKKITALGYLILILPYFSQAQSVDVIGGTEIARDCFLNSQSVIRNPEFATRSLLEPCDFSLQNVDMKKSDRAATHTNRGIIRQAIGNFDGAFSDFNAAMGLLPKTPQIFVNRGNTFLETKDYQMALEDYDHALGLGMTYTHIVYLNMGIAYERLGNKSQAERSYREAIQANPDWNEPRNRLTKLLQPAEATQ